MNSILKAIYGGITAGVATLGSLLAANNGHMNTIGWVGVASSVLATFGSVYGVTNIPKTPAP
jgi:hypothetical protein